MTLFYLFKFEIYNSKTITYIGLVWLGSSTIYLCYPVFKSWFYYWDPDFSFTRPA